MAKKRIIAHIGGEVQGVGFRYFTRDAARELGLSGYVRNLWDGGVEAVAEGEEGHLARFIGILKEGPPRAEVTEFDVSWGEPENKFDGFYIR